MLTGSEAGSGTARLKASSVGSGNKAAGSGGSGGGESGEVVMVVRSPSLWGRTVSGKGSGGGTGVVLGYEQSSFTRASSESLPA